jgi:AcrR family transcriptional regulator
MALGAACIAAGDPVLPVAPLPTPRVGKEDMPGAVSRQSKVEWSPQPAPERSPAPVVRIRQTLRDVQKRRTRRKLLAAGKQVFAHGGYMTCRVEEIVAAAGISRAAFYLHYKSKHALLHDILVDSFRWQRRRYRNLKSQNAPSADQLQAWIESFVKGYSVGRDALSLFNFAASIHPDFSALNYTNRHQFVLMLGRQVPAFSVTNAAGEIDAERHAGLYLLLFEMEQLCLQIALGYWPTDPKIAIRTVANRFLDFGRATPAV